jgi:formate dehydrogenase accessory protein FdhD
MFPVSITGVAQATDQQVKVDGGEHWAVPEETPVAFVYDRRNYAVMLATPADLIDFAVGFSLTEKIIDAPADIAAIDVHHYAHGVDIRLRIAAHCLERFDVRQRRRTLPGNAGCGVCGLENADEFFVAFAPVADDQRVLDPAIAIRALGDLSAHQPLNERTRSVHGAAWATANGAIHLVREDVGRHNALDKMLGALALAAVDMDLGFVVMSSRCSYEIVQKAAARRVRALVCMSAPTSFAIAKAKEARIALYVRSGAGVTAISG